MEIILAKTAGFCFGVKRAVDLAFQAPSLKGTYTLGPIIHNDRVIKKLEDEKQIYAIKELEETSLNQIIIRSHGVGKKIYDQAEQKQIKMIDATCPYVKKIHQFVNQYTQEGYDILIVGNKRHPEVIGITGWANKNYIILKDYEELKKHTLSLEKKYLVVAQTTYKREIVLEIIKELEEKGYTFEFKDTICKATKERQEEAALLSKKVDCMLVIGSSYSSNTQKLFEICKENCKRTYCIEDEKSLQKEWFKKQDQIGITAGASTPSECIEEVLEALHKINDAMQ